MEVTLLDSSMLAVLIFDGAIDVNVSGGNGNNNYSWSGPNFTHLNRILMH